MKKQWQIRALTALLLLAMLVSCGKTEDGGETKSGTDTENTTESSENAETESETEETGEKPDLPSDLSFDGKSFTFGVINNKNARNLIVPEELTGEALNDAQYNTIQQTNEALNVKIGQNILTSNYPAAQDVITLVMAGDDVVQVANVYCADVPNLLTGGYVMSYRDVPYIDLEKPWWDKKVNDTLMVSDIRYAVNGDLNITTHDLTYVLVFSKDQIIDNSLENPYDLVNSGTWTMDKMSEMMLTVTNDRDGNGEWNARDSYGYTSAIKMTLPSFWIGAGETAVALDENNIPTLSMGSERFYDVIQKIFAITYDTGVRFRNEDNSDVPTDGIQLFQNDRALFMDCSLFYMTALRDMEADFGIIPYPKFDEAQENYCARVSYFMPSMLLSTNTDLPLVGAVLEYANYRAQANITPAYYDVSLKGKVSRDEESAAMLDLILANRVVDLADTIFCADMRDSFFSAMYGTDVRDMASVMKANEKTLTKMLNAFVENSIAAIDKK